MPHLESLILTYNNLEDLVREGGREEESVNVSFISFRTT